MMKAATLALLLGTALMAVGLACSDDGEPADTLTLEEYFAEMETIFFDSISDTERIQEEWDERRAEPDLTNEDLLVLDREEGLAQLAAYNDTVSRVGNLKPPSNASAAHKAYSEALTEISKLFTDSISPEDLDELSDEEFEEVSEASELWLSTCTILLELAEANEIEARPCGIPSR